MLYFHIIIVVTFWLFHWSLYKMLLILLRNSAFFPVNIAIRFTWFCDIILLSKRFFRKNIWIWKIHFKNLCWTYVWPDLYLFGHNKGANNIYFKACPFATSLMHVKHSMHNFFLWHLLSGTLESRKRKKKRKHQIE